MVDVDGSCQFSTDSQPKSTGLVWGLAATRRSVYIHQMNLVRLVAEHRPDLPGELYRFPDPLVAIRRREGKGWKYGGEEAEEREGREYNTIQIQYNICKAPCCRGFRGAGEQDS